MTEQERKTIAIIDGNSLMHRAFHAVPPYMTASDGTPTNAIFGFMQMFIKLIENFSVWGVIVCFDKGKPKKRMKILPQYKANRPSQDEDLRVQFPIIKNLLAALSIPVIELEGWEGDDLLGTIAKKGEKQPYDFLLFTGDQDMYQLIDEHIKIASTKKGMSDVVIMDTAAVEDLYAGITPKRIPDFYGLKGDPSDNIPGVPGVGPKKAAALIQEFGSLEEVFEHADKIPGKMGENIRKHKEDALLSKQVATIQCDAPIELDLEETEFPIFDHATAAAAFSRLAFTTIEKKFFAATRTEFSVNNATSFDSLLEVLEIENIVEGSAAHQEFDRILHEQEWVGVSFEEVKTPQLFQDNEILYVQTSKMFLKFGEGEAKPRLKSLLENGRVAAIDTKGLLHKLAPTNINEPALIEIERLDSTRLFDCGVAAYLLNSSFTSYGTLALAENYLQKSLRGEKKMQEEACVAQALIEPLNEKLEKNGVWFCYREIEMPLVLVLAAMERRGIKVDKAVLAEQTKELSKDVAHLQTKIFQTVGEEFNLSSPLQLSYVLFDVLNLPHEGLKRTKKGFISTNAQVLEDLAKNYEVIRDILSWRELSKIITTYLEPLSQCIASDGRVHTSFNQTVTTTGRLSSSNPNLQNIPIKNNFGKRVRRAFKVPRDHVFLTADYSQIELRLLAHLSKDPELIKAFQDGKDFHTQTAARVFGVNVEDVNSEMRSRAKAVNFGIVYGQHAFGLSKTLSISTKEAQAMIDAYYTAYPAVRAYLDRIVTEAKRLGFAETMYGRKRLLPELKSENRMVLAAAEREAMNLPMQGSAADIIKIAMISVERALHEKGLGAELVLQIHDELDLSVPKEEIRDVEKLVKDKMEHAATLSIPLVVDISYGLDWAEAEAK